MNRKRRHRKFFSRLDRPAPRSKPMDFIRHPDKIMLARNEFHSGQSVWKYELGEWVCVQASECLKFLVKLTARDAKLELLRRGFSWRWS